MCSTFFTAAEVEDDQRSAQGRHRFPKSLLLAKKSYPKKSGQKNRRESPLSTQSVLLASILKPSDAKEGVFSQNYNSPDSFREGLETRDHDQSLDDRRNFDERETGQGLTRWSQFSHDYNTPDSFRAGVETRDEIDQNILSAAPKLFTGQYNTPDKFREGFESRDISVFQEDDFISPDETVQDLNDDNEVPGDSPGIFLGLKDGVIVPEDESVPDEFRGQGKGKIPSSFNPELEDLEEVYYGTGNRLAEISAEDDSHKYGADSEGKAYTEGGLVYLPKQSRGKNKVKMPCRTNETYSRLYLLSPHRYRQVYRIESMHLPRRLVKAAVLSVLMKDTH